MMQPTSLRIVQRTSFETMNCSVAQCLEVVGEWWSMLIIRDAFLGVRRFDDFQSRLGISRNILNVRLTTLVEAGVLERVPYQQRPLRFEYRLSDKGRDPLAGPHHHARVGRQMGSAERRPPRSRARRRAGKVKHLNHTCSACGQPADRHSLHLRPGPGATPSDFDRTTLVSPTSAPRNPAGIR